MTETLEECLAIIFDNSILHARWLNTFSFLEYVGFRKIVKSQSVDSMNLETLSHAVEEGRHALFLKRLALKTGGREFSVYRPQTLLCADEAEAYFQKLDQYCESALVEVPVGIKTRLTYLYVTWLVEFRALNVYEEYQTQLSARGLPLILQGILKEEDKHLRSVRSELQSLDSNLTRRLEELSEIENGLYREYLSELSRQLSVENYASGK